MLKIEKSSDGNNALVRLCGRLRSEHLAELKEHIEAGAESTVLDLEDVTLVDLGIVHFLARCEAAGMELRHCSPYIREWMLREQHRQG